jgi:hypothetical protein
MGTQAAFDLAGFTRATEDRNAPSLLGMYAEDAEVHVVDSNHPPRSPQVIQGKDAIGDWLEDTYSRDMTHRVLYPVVGEDRVALNTLCQYPDGTQVWCACTANVADGLITKQYVIQVWDD